MTSTARDLLCVEDSDGDSRQEDSDDLEESKTVSREDDSDSEVENATDTAQKQVPTSQASKTAKKGKTGVVYLSRIPPYMKPAKVKQILSRFGPVGRIYLSPEDRAEYISRKKSGGNRRKKFVEGWVEFVRKRHAKLAAETLNGKTLGGRKRSYYYDDILNVKYLSKFKWSDLIEQMALEAQEHQERLKAEISQATRENRMFMSGVERVRLEARSAQSGQEQVKEPPVPKQGQHSVHFNFDQRGVSSRRAGDRRGSASQSAVGATVLSKVFGT